eukprot:5030472-Pyramimonas_sp.AAC.1
MPSLSLSRLHVWGQTVTYQGGDRLLEDVRSVEFNHIVVHLELVAALEGRHLVRVALIIALEARRVRALRANAGREAPLLSVRVLRRAISVLEFPVGTNVEFPAGVRLGGEVDLVIRIRESGARGILIGHLVENLPHLNAEIDRGISGSLNAQLHASFHSDVSRLREVERLRSTPCSRLHQGQPTKPTDACKSATSVVRSVKD